MSEKMDVRTAIRIAQEEAARLEKIVRDMEELGLNVKNHMKTWAQGAKEMAEAMRVLIRIAQAFLTAGEE